MGELPTFLIRFFHGWRRKIGFVMLVLASIASIEWARSFTFRDVFAFRQGDSTVAFRSFEGGIGWQRFTPSSSIASTGWQSTSHFKFSISDPWWRFDNFEDDEIDWQWDWGGFSFGSASKTQPKFLKRHLELWIVPYWSFVPALTLVSVYLIYFKSRKAGQKELSEVEVHEKR